MESISGAIYSGLPQKESDRSLLLNSSLDNPKSVILMCPSKSTRIFSGYRNNKMIYILPSNLGRVYSSYVSIQSLKWPH